MTLHHDRIENLGNVKGIKFRYDGKGFAETRIEGHDRSLLVSLFESMLRIRRIEEVIESKYHEDEMKSPIHLVIGQEAVCVGACAALEKTDLAYTSHRTHGVYLAKGGSLKGMLAELFCRKSGCAGSRGGSMHLVDLDVGMAGSSAICGGNVPIAAGLALAMQQKGEKRVSACFFGDGGAEEGVVWETLNFSALKKLPIVFLCENNFFSVFTPLEKRQPLHTELWRKAQAFGVSAELVDGTNVLAVYEAMQRAVDRARKGDGPTFLEARVYRWRGHGGSGDDSNKGYRDPAEVAEWQKNCPIECYYDFLKARQLVTDADRARMEAAFTKEIAEAFEFASKSPNPTEGDLWTHVYKDAPLSDPKREGR